MLHLPDGPPGDIREGQPQARVLSSTGREVPVELLHPPQIRLEGFGFGFGFDLRYLQTVLTSDNPLRLVEVLAKLLLLVRTLQ